MKLPSRCLVVCSSTEGGTMIIFLPLAGRENYELMKRDNEQTVLLIPWIKEMKIHWGSANPKPP